MLQSGKQRVHWGAVRPLSASDPILPTFNPHNEHMARKLASANFLWFWCFVAALVGACVFLVLFVFFGTSGAVKVVSLTLPPQASHTTMPATVETQVGIALSGTHEAVLAVSYARSGAENSVYHAGTFVVPAGTYDLSFPLPAQAVTEMAAGVTASNFTIVITVEAYCQGGAPLGTQKVSTLSTTMNLVVPTPST